MKCLIVSLDECLWMRNLEGLRTDHHVLNEYFYRMKISYSICRHVECSLRLVYLIIIIIIITPSWICFVYLFVRLLVGKLYKQRDRYETYVASVTIHQRNTWRALLSHDQDQDHDDRQARALSHTQ